MAKKKEPSIDEALNIFKDAINRASLLSPFLYTNSTLLSENAIGKTTLLVPETNLWLKLLEDNDLKESIREIDISNPIEHDKLELYQYAEKIEDKSLWYDLNTDDLYAGKIIKIKISDKYDYDVPINKNILPIKLKKSEFNNISYRIFIRKHIVLAIKKKFVYEGIPDASFSIIKLLKVI